MILELERKENCFTIEFSRPHLQNETISLFLLRNRQIPRCDSRLIPWFFSYLIYVESNKVWNWP